MIIQGNLYIIFYFVMQKELVSIQYERQDLYILTVKSLPAISENYKYISTLDYKLRKRTSTAISENFSSDHLVRHFDYQKRKTRFAPQASGETSLVKNMATHFLALKRGSHLHSCLCLNPR